RTSARSDAHRESKSETVVEDHNAVIRRSSSAHWSCVNPALQLLAIFLLICQMQIRWADDGNEWGRTFINASSRSVRMMPGVLMPYLERALASTLHAHR